MEDHAPSDVPVTAAAPAPSHDFRVVAVGRAGITAMEQLCGAGSLAGVDLIAIHTDEAVVKRSRAPFRLVINSGQPRGLGAGGDPSLGEAAAERDAAVIRPLFQGARLVFVITGLGAGTGTGAAPVVARLARETGALVLGVATLPFHCEGRLRTGHAHNGLQSLKASADAVITVPNQRVLATLDRATPAIEVFAVANRLLMDGVRGLWHALSRPGLIQFDFASLERLLRGRHSESVFVSVEARGDHRVRDVIERFKASPFVGDDQFLASTDAVLVAISVGPDVPFSEIEAVLSHVQRQADQAQVVTGTSIDPALAGTIVLTLVASVGGSAPLPEPASRTDVGAASMPVEGSRRGAEARSIGDFPGMASAGTGRSTGGLVPPAPDLTAEQREHLGSGGMLRGTLRGASRKKKVVQATFNFDLLSRGRFEKTEATILHGQDLDVPTFLRRGIALN